MKYNIGDFKVSIGNDEVKVKLWTSRDERSWLSQKTEDSTFADMCSALIFPNIEYKPMTLDEFKYLIVKLREKSVSNSINFSYMCDGTLRFKIGENGMEKVDEKDVDENTIVQPCNNKVESDIQIEDLVNFMPSTIKNNIIKAADVEIKIQKIPTKDLMLKVLNEKTLEDQKYFEFLACVKEVKYGKETYNAFTFDEIKEFFDSVPSSIFNELYEQFFEIKGYLKFFTVNTCPVCGQKNRVIFDNVLDFL